MSDISQDTFTAVFDAIYIKHEVTDHVSAQK